MNSKNFQELIKNLQVFYKCPSCSANYHLDDIKFLGQVDNHCFMQLSCHGCSLPVLATVFLDSKKSFKNGSKIPNVSKKTDLRPKEKHHFIEKGVISSSEIADLYLYLDSKTDFTNLNK